MIKQFELLISLILLVNFSFFEESNSSLPNSKFLSIPRFNCLILFLSRSKPIIDFFFQKLELMASLHILVQLLQLLRFFFLKIIFGNILYTTQQNFLLLQ